MSRLARGGAVRDHEDLSHTRVTGFLDDLRRRLASRFGESHERGTAVSPPGSVVVPVRFHVIASGETGRLSQKEVGGQLAALNAAYSGRTGGADTGVRFRLVSVDITDNADWFAGPRRYEKDLKTALHRGGPGTLNLYSAAVGSTILGVSTFPQWYALRPVFDGVMIDYRSIPGGSNPRYHRGYTAVHEVGHWLGLFHTFENGCEHPGDAVDDTPYEGSPAQGCPQLEDTCTAPGLDPVHNFMDYGFDLCMHEFTAGQGSRIRAVWAAYRAGDAAPAGAARATGRRAGAGRRAVRSASSTAGRGLPNAPVAH